MLPSVALIILTPFEEKVRLENVYVLVTETELDPVIAVPESSVNDIVAAVS